MRQINDTDIGEKLLLLLKEEHPVDEDIGILDKSGEVIGVVIPKEAYDFFLEKVEEEEDRQDKESVNQFRKSGEKEE